MGADGFTQERNKRWRDNNRAAYSANQKRKVLRAKGRLDESDKPSACQVCETPGPTVFDHDHLTGFWRGWLCHRCNQFIGLACDDPERLRRAAAYLEAHAAAENKSDRVIPYVRKA